MDKRFHLSQLRWVSYFCYLIVAFALYGCALRGFSLTSAPAVPVLTTWPLEGANPARTRAVDTAIAPPLTVQDRYVVGGDTQFVSPVALSADQLFADGDHRLHAFDRQTFQERWRIALPGSFLSPTIVDDTVYLRVEAGDKGFLVALDRQTGEERWQYQFASVGSAYGNVGGHVTAPVVVDDLLFVGAAQTLHAFNRHTGAIVWEFATDDPISTSVAVADGALYFADFTHLYALDRQSGAEQWRFVHQAQSFFFAPIVSDDLVITADGPTLFAVNRTTGKAVWQRTFDEDVIPAAATTEQVYAKTVTGLWALEQTTGAVVWSYHTLNFISLPVVTAEALYVIIRGDGGSYLQALQRTDGKMSWQSEKLQLSNSAPVVGGDTVYVRTVNGGILGFRPAP